MDQPNKLRHIFGNPNHYLGPLVQRYGSEQTAFRAMEDEVNKAYQDGKLVLVYRSKQMIHFIVCGRAWPGHPRFAANALPVSVDAQHKAGHERLGRD